MWGWGGGGGGFQEGSGMRNVQCFDVLGDVPEGRRWEKGSRSHEAGAESKVLDFVLRRCGTS